MTRSRFSLRSAPTRSLSYSRSKNGWSGAPGRIRTRSRVAGIGLLVGVGGALIADHASGGERWSGFTAIGATVFGVLGTLVGATIGGNFPTEGWQAVRMSSGARLSIVPRAEGRLALAYSVPF